MTYRRRTITSILRHADPEPTALMLGAGLVGWVWWYALVSYSEWKDRIGVIAAPFDSLNGHSQLWLAALFSAVGLNWMMTLRKPDASIAALAVSGLLVTACHMWIGLALCSRYPGAWRSTATPIYMIFLPSMLGWSMWRIIADAWRRRA